MEVKENEIGFASQKVGEVLKWEKLSIPAYQRPYKWQRKHIRNLFYDVRDAMGKKEYQIGSVILHEEVESLDIVDGQQRLISISLFLHVLKMDDDYKGARRLLEADDYGDLSCQHAHENYNEWQNLIQLVGEEEAERVCKFLLNNCSVSVITMPQDRLAEAFQLFDSQNNRGKSLAPHDLLKAYHLRVVSNADEKLVEKWEEFVDDDSLNLQELFDQNLFRMRRWSRGETGLTKRRYGSYLRFTEEFIDDFKGVDLSDETIRFPYLELYRNMGNFQSITMPIINGERFFKYVEDAHQTILEHKKYLGEILSITDEGDSYGQQLQRLDFPEGMLKIFNSTKGRYLRCRNLFINITFLFAERFGAQYLNKEVLETLFIWSYYPRANAKAIYDSTLGNYAAGGKFQNRPNQKLFLVLANAVSPSDFLMKIDRDLFENFTVEKIEKEDGKW